MAVITKDLGPVSAYAVAVENGYTGTEAEWEQYIANASNNAQAAAQSASAAANSATAAQTAKSATEAARDDTLTGLNAQNTRLTAAESDIDALEAADVAMGTRITAAENAIAAIPTVPVNIKDGSGTGSIIEGQLSTVTASGGYAHAEGEGTSANGTASHAEGMNTTTKSGSGMGAHAEGSRTNANGSYSHAEGSGTTAGGLASHTEGQNTTTSAQYAHAEGTSSSASGIAAHAEGQRTNAAGSASHAEGDNTIASHHAQHVFGKYNIADDSAAEATAVGNYAEIVGNGTADNARSNARTLDWSGNEALAGDLTIHKGGNDEKTLGTTLTAIESRIDTVESVVGDFDLSFAQVKQIVQGGNAAKYLPIGSQLVDTWKKTADAAALDAPWDVVHHADDGTYLEQHYATPDGIPFDEPEAIYYAGSGGLAAGSYHIAIGAGYGSGWVAGNYIGFTLSSAMAEGDQLVISCGQDNANNPGGGRAWNVYAKGSTTSKQNGTTTATANGTLLGTIGQRDAHTPNGQLNAISRVVYGYNRWAQSTMRQWLNSTGAAGAWWTAQNDWDRPPTAAATTRGWLAGCTDDFLSVLEPVAVVTALNNFDVSGSVTTETTMDRIFLRSLQEGYINPQLANIEGVDWDYYKTLAQEAGLAGKFQQGSTYPILISYRLDDHASPVHVRLRSCGRGNASSTWAVYSSGHVSNYYAYTANRARPACKIKKS